MIARVYMTDTETGEERSFDYDVSDDLELVDFFWSEGNASCDCWRADYFARAGTPQEPDPELQCDDMRFAVKIVRGEQVIYSDGLYSDE